MTMRFLLIDIILTVLCIWLAYLAGVDSGHGECNKALEHLNRNATSVEAARHP